MRLPCGFLQLEQREPGGRGRIRTFVARKERQIYSLLVLATHPPVRKKSKTPRTCLLLIVHAVFRSLPAKNTKRTRVQRHQPFYVSMTGFASPHSPGKSGGAGGGN